MSPQIGQAAFRIAVFLVVMGLVLLPFQTPGTAEYIVTWLTLGVGLLMAAVIILIIKRSNR